MSFFRHLFKSEQPRPMWVAQLSQQEYSEFRTLVESTIKGMRLSVHINWDEGCFLGNSDNEGGTLFQLARSMSGKTPAQRAEEVQRFFLIVASNKEAGHLSSQSLRDCLRIRMYSPDAPVSGMVSKEFGKLFSAAVVLDRLTFVQSYTPGSAASSGLGDVQAFEAALNNTFQREPVDRRGQDIGNGLRVLFFESETPYVASHALLLAKHFSPEDQLLVVVPSRTMLGVVKLADSKSPAQVARLAQFSKAAFAAAEAPITPHVALWNKGEFSQITEHIGGKVEIQPGFISKLAA